MKVELIIIIHPFRPLDSPKSQEDFSKHKKMVQFNLPDEWFEYREQGFRVYGTCKHNADETMDGTVEPQLWQPCYDLKMTTEQGEEMRQKVQEHLIEAIRIGKESGDYSKCAANKMLIMFNDLRTKYETQRKLDVFKEFVTEKSVDPVTFDTKFIGSGDRRLTMEYRLNAHDFDKSRANGKRKLIKINASQIFGEKHYKDGDIATCVKFYDDNQETVANFSRRFCKLILEDWCRMDQIDGTEVESVLNDFDTSVNRLKEEQKMDCSQSVQLGAAAAASGASTSSPGGL